ncbi:L7Ae/L30e/S12e/Gadd45 family ribosomal protein [Dysosmobacter sp.]
MDNNHILSLLGLCLRGSHLAVGEEPVEAAARAKDARVVLLAADAASGTRRRAEHFAEMGQCLWLQLPFSKAELGRAVGRTSAAMVAVLDIGLASAVLRRLAQLDPGRYEEAAARLDLKAQRAAERRAEQLAHEKNIRQGKRRPPKAAPVREEPPAPPSSPVGATRTHRAAGAQKPGPKRRSGGERAGHSARPRAEGAGRPFRAKSEGAARSSRPRSGEGTGASRLSRESRPKAKSNPYAHSRPVKKGKGSFRKKEH